MVDWQEFTIDVGRALSVGTLFMVRSEAWTDKYKVRKIGEDCYRVYAAQPFECPITGFHPASNFERIDFAILPE